MSQIDLKSIFDQGIIVIVRGVKPQHIVPTVEALYAGGIRAVEVTFNHKSAATIQETLQSMRLIQERFKGKILMGAGTVLTAQQVEAAAECGARYMISPNVDVSVIRRTKELGCLSFPGALTPTEIVCAYSAGADAVKLFPSGTMGPEYIKAIMGPLGHIPYFAVGGIYPDNMKQFLDIGVKGFGIGGGLIDVKAIEAGEFAGITELASRYTSNWKLYKKCEVAL